MKIVYTIVNCFLISYLYDAHTQKNENMLKCQYCSKNKISSAQANFSDKFLKLIGKKIH